MSAFLPSIFFPDTEDDVAAPMSWKETPRCHVYEFDLPGLSKDDVKLEFHEDTRLLHVTGAQPDKLDDHTGTDRWHLLERPRRFSRKLVLPENAKSDGISAAMHDGVLVVTVPKDEDAIKKDTTKNMQGRKVVEISGNSDEEEKGAHKGLGRFVCCRA